MKLEDYIAVIKDYPKKGISFKDITPLVGNGEAYRYTIEQLALKAKALGAEYICSPEARGFLFGCPVAEKLGIGFIPVRKKGKLPRETIKVSYELEYGTDELYMHKDAIKSGAKVVLIDDLIAVGGTMSAVANLVEIAGGKVVGCLAVILLKGLPGEKRLAKYGIDTLLTLED